VSVSITEDGASQQEERSAGDARRDGAGSTDDVTELRRQLAATQASEALKARIIERSPDCLKVLDLEGRLLSMNAGGVAALEIDDLPAALNTCWVDFWQGADREAAQAAVDAARAGAVGRFVGFFATVRTQQPRWWHVVVSALPGPDGKPEKLLAVSRDITEWKRADQLLRALTESTAATLGGDFFRQLVRHLATALGVRNAFVAECLPNQRARSLGFWTEGHPADNFEYDLDGTPCLGVLEGCTRFYPTRLGDLFPKVKLAGDRAPDSYFGAPMFDASGRVIGHLVVTHDQPMSDDPLLFSVVETFAARAGAELERARATHRERAILDVNNAIISNLTEEALLQAISDALARVVPFDRAALTLHDPATDVLRILALSGRLPPRNYPVGIALDRKDSHVGWVFDHQRTLLRRNLETERQFSPEHRLYDEGVRSLCTAPLLLGGKCIGTLTLGSTTPNQFTEVEELFLRDVCNQLALAISNMRAFEEIAALKARLQAENLYLQEEIRGEHDFSEIVGQSPALRELLRQVDQVAPIDSTVLITGETGSGKELVARAIHDRSARRDHSLVKVNCGAISAGLVESELFGHVKGAFTGALGNRDGRFKLADGGSIFLDEIGELPLDAQVKLLRVLQEQEFEPVGSSKSVKVDVRVIAATNRDLAAAVAAGKFRGDLYYRLNVVPIQVPSLRERAGDVELLVQFFLQKFAKKFDRPIRRVAPETMERLRAYAWPGNIRELQNVIERAVVLARGDTLTIGPDIAPALPLAPAAASPPPGPAVVTTPPGPVVPGVGAGETLNDVERRHIEAVLLQKNWTIEGDRGAAKVLNMHPNTLRSRIKKLGLRRPG
jgi:formate hydrogenlyase transcriptional activator